MSHADFTDGVSVEFLLPVRVHVDAVRCRAANWVEVRGWIAGVARGKAQISASLPDACLVLSERPDVCAALSELPAYAYGFAVHLLAREPFSGGETCATLLMDGTPFARLSVPFIPNTLPFLPFASEASVRLTRELYRHPRTGKPVDECDDVISLGYGVIVPKDLESGFDNTRVGNYHPEAVRQLARPGVIGLDVGCGIRDRVFDNLVTQDIYPTPTATLVTQPEEKKLPFPDGVFDVILLDSVLEHVPNPVAFLGEARRVLKKAGTILGDVPFLQPLHLAPHHYFNFTPYGLASVANQAGLDLDYARAEDHQRPEFSLEWLLRRTFEAVGEEEATRLRALSLGDFHAELAHNKHAIAYPPDALEELSAGYRFSMRKG